MTRTLLTRRLMVAVGAGAIVVTGAVVAVPAEATGVPAGAAGGPSTSVTAFLAAPDLVGLQRLAATTGLSHAQRIAALRTLVPSASTLNSVASTLRSEGLHVTHETSWSVTAEGPRTTVGTTFGTRPALAAHPSIANYRAATGALPQLPGTLAGAVSAVYPTTGGPAPFHHSATTTLEGTDFRNADTPAGVKPSTGQKDAGTTVATLQLADFYGNTPADLTSYANEHGLTDPVADGQYQKVTVDGGPSANDDATGGDVEVDLDQESILSTAPTADQHAYFAPNTNAGFDDVFANVYDDVTGSSRATAPDPHITALSTSWGGCETLTGASAVKALQPIVTAVVAAGVTVFASSGDDGIYDCRSASMTGLDNSQADVDYPASSPNVVSVGGSNLVAPSSAPNTGLNWTESAWSCTDPVSCQSTAGTGGTGGGESGSAYGTTVATGGTPATATDNFKGFPAPEYQRVGITDRPFAGATHRLVPDITADGDPSTGFLLYTSNPQYVAEAGGSNDLQVGGTSLASPISAAQLDNTLAAAGRRTGVGDIHGALYSAADETASLAATSSHKVFRDVTSGANGAPGDRGTDPSVSAQRGYDTTSGVGGVLWPALAPYLLNTTRPSASGRLSGRHAFRTSTRVTARWKATRGGDTSLLGPTSVRIKQAGAKQALFSTIAAASAGSRSFTAKRGHKYVLTVLATDLSGKVSKLSTTTVRIPRRH